MQDIDRGNIARHKMNGALADLISSPRQGPLHDAVPATARSCDQKLCFSLNSLIEFHFSKEIKSITSLFFRPFLINQLLSKSASRGKNADILTKSLRSIIFFVLFLSKRKSLNFMHFHV